MSELPSYRFGPRREGSLFGLATSQIVTLVIATTLALVAILAARSALVGLGLLGLGATAAFLPIAGRAAVTWFGPVAGRLGSPKRGAAPLSAQRLGTKAGIARETSRSSERVAWHLPGLARLTLRSVEMAHGALGIAQFGSAGRGASFTVSLSGPRFGLVDVDAQTRALSSWGQLLGSVARSGAELERIELCERVVPDDLAGQWAFLESVATTADRRARAIYRSELDELAGTAVRHEVLLTAVLARGGRHVEAAAVSACTVLVAQLEAAGFAARPLDLPALAASLRAGLDPVGVTPLVSFDDEALSPARHAPSSWRAGWGSITVDGSIHACFEATAFPRVPVGPEWAWPLVLAEHPVVRRTLALHVELQRPEAALRHAERAVVAHESDEALRSKWGFRSGARREQELVAALSRESELAEGFADARFVLLVDLAAETEGELTTAARALLSQAAHGHVELRRLYGRQAQGLVATLPLGVVRLQGGWR